MTPIIGCQVNFSRRSSSSSPPNSMFLVTIICFHQRKGSSLVSLLLLTFLKYMFSEVEVLPFCFLPGHWLFIPSGEEKWTLTYSGSQFCVVVIVLILNLFFTAHLIMDARFNFDIVYRKSHNLVCKITHFLHVSGTSFICLNSDNKTVQGLLFIIKKVNGCNYFILHLSSL